MCNNELLIGYLYDDLSPADRAEFEAHLAGCAHCRREVAELGQTRHHLASWAPPEPSVNFRVVRSASAPPVRRLARVPQWALAAAASLLVLAGAAAIANLEVRYGADGVVVRTGWGSDRPAVPDAAQAAAPQAVPAAAPAPASEKTVADIAALQRRITELERSQSEQTLRTVAAVAPGITTPELRKVLAQYEARQREELALHIKQLWTDINTARRNDFYRVQQALAPELQRQQQSIDTHQRSIDSLLFRTAQYK